MLQLDIFFAACKGTFKLGLICSAVMALMQSGVIPPDTPRVLSAVAFNLTIPCMLFTNVAQTLASSTDPALLMVPLAAACQIAVGSIIGRFAADWAVKPAPKQHTGTPAQQIIAESVADAAGLPRSTVPALVLPQDPPPPGMHALVLTACAFGNSLTLPLIMLLTLLPSASVVTVTGYMALFLLGWSPLFWTFGFRLVTQSGSPSGDSPPQSTIIKPAIAGVQNDYRIATVGNTGDMRTGNVRGGWPEVGTSFIEVGPGPGMSMIDNGSGPVIDISMLPQDMADLPSIRQLERAESSAVTALTGLQGINGDSGAVIGGASQARHVRCFCFHFFVVWILRSSFFFSHNEMNLISGVT